MPEFLSPEWIDALDREARGSALLAACAADGDLVLEQRVVLTDGTEAAHHLVLAGDGVRVVAGHASDPSIVLSTDLATARGLAEGTVNAQGALAAGRLRVGADVETLTRRADALLALDDVFAAVRADTTYPDPDGAPITSAE